MSRLMRPVGPLPARVYWTRRLLLAVLVAVVVVLVWWLVGRGGDAGATASQSHRPPEPGGQAAPQSVDTSDSPTTPPSPAPTTSAPTQTPASQTPASQTPTTDPEHTSRPTARDRSEPSSTATRQGEQHTAEPSKRGGSAADDAKQRCDVTALNMHLQVSDAASGKHNPITFKLSTSGDDACTLAITPDTLAVQITSGADTIWSSSDCPDQLPAKRVTVTPQPTQVYTFTWNGRRSTDRCAIVGDAAEPGGYWVHAAFIGGEPHKAYFDVTASDSP